jgi:cytosine/adenosine deaminase-related metal-dependent hydrolase
VLLKNDHSPVSFPLLNPYGHVAFQAQRGDVHTVLVDGRVVKRDHRLVGIDLAGVQREVEATVEHLRSALGEEAWEKGMNPDVPETSILDNPYTYTGYRSASTHGR